MRTRGLRYIFVVLAAAAAVALYTFWDSRDDLAYRAPLSESLAEAEERTSEPVADVPKASYIGGLSHVWQTFNNCSSVALLVALSHWDIRDTQERIADGTRPWRNQKGDNDDKAVDLFELAAYTRENHPGMLTYVRPNGDIELLKKFVANDIPVVTRTLMYAGKDFQHYRTVRGYDDARGVIIESNGLDGPDHTYSYSEWLAFWKDFNYSYLIVVPESKKKLVEDILGEEKNERTAWQRAKERAESELAKDPSDLRAAYNVLTALYYLGDYEGTVREFEKIESRLGENKLWYQAEPIYAYFELGEYDRVIALSDSVINNNNASVSELYVLKGKIYESRGDSAAAKAEYEKAVYYNRSLKSAREALAALGA